MMERTADTNAGGVLDWPPAGAIDSAESYARYADVYDALFDDLDADAQFYITEADARVGAHQQLLEIGVGTGRLTARLLRNAHRVVGLDASTEMLSRALSKFGSDNRVELVAGDIRTLALGGTAFPLVIAPLRIASITASTIGILPEVLARYRARYPDVDVSVETWALEDGIRALVERRVDVAFVRAPLSDRRLDSILVAEEDICVALPATHPLASKKKISLAALHGLDVIGMRDELTGGFNEWITKLLADNDVVVRSVRDTGGIETMLGLVASGMGVAIVSAVLQTLLIKGVVLRPLHPRRSIENLHLAWRVDRSTLPTVRSFQKHVVASALSFTAGGHPGSVARK